MVEPTVPLFRDDPYMPFCEATVIAHAPDGGVVLDRTVFYAAGGGQPGDMGHLEDAHGTRFQIATSRYGEDRSSIIHQVEGEACPAVGTQVRAVLDWDRRQRHMRMHSALHLLTAVLAYPVTGGQIGADESRLDFDIPDGGLDKDAIAQAVNELITADHAISAEWITDAELDANPALVKTMSVQPPRGSGRIRLIRIGSSVDLQPCGGTHVRSTGEIGPIAVTKIEKKGKQNRRVRIRLTDS